MNKVTAVIIHHENKNQRYLDWCLKSLVLQEGVNLEINLMATTLEPPSIEMIDGAFYKLNLHHIDRNTSPEKALNLGCKLARPDSDYYILLNDDVILSRHAIQVMADTIQDSNFILNAWSNCDMGWLYYGHPKIEANGKKLRAAKQMRYEQVHGFEESIIQLPKFEKLMIPTPWLCFYATMIPKDLFWKVGGNDERFELAQSDQHFCLKAAKHFDTKCMVTMETFIWHYGGVTVEHSLTDAKRAENERKYIEILKQDGMV